jgi:GTP-binding protein YchF
MKVGLVGLPGSGKSTLFRAITRSDGSGEPVRTVDVPDARVDTLAEIFKPKKKTYAKVDVVDLPGVGSDPRKGAQLMASIRDTDALALVVRGFEDDSYPYDRPDVDVRRDLESLIGSFQLADFVMIETRIEKLEKSVHKPTKSQEQDKRELELLKRLQEALESGARLEDLSLKASEEEMIRGFRFLTQKPVLVLVDLPDDGAREADLVAAVPESFPRTITLRGSLEAEIAQLDPADAAAFMEEYGLEVPAREALVTALYDVLGLCSFLTAGEDECRAWAIRRGATALEAAGAIHSDIQRGFIRAEVVPFANLVEAGGFKEAKARNAMRLEGKEYAVADGEVVHFRFSV